MTIEKQYRRIRSQAPPVGGVDTLFYLKCAAFHVIRQARCAECRARVAA
jgi:hypothetical protein